MDDLISRQAAITAIQKAYADTEGGEDKCAVWKNVGLTNALHIMQDLPSVQQERKTGRWVERNPQNSPDCRLIECSECGNAYIVGYDIDYDDWIDGRDFCMRCGADLRGGSNGKST